MPRVAAGRPNGSRHARSGGCNGATARPRASGRGVSVVASLGVGRPRGRGWPPWPCWGSAQDSLVSGCPEAARPAGRERSVAGRMNLLVRTQRHSLPVLRPRERSWDCPPARIPGNRRGGQSLPPPDGPVKAGEERRSRRGRSAVIAVIRFRYFLRNPGFFLF